MRAGYYGEGGVKAEEGFTPAQFAIQKNCAHIYSRTQTFLIISSNPQTTLVSTGAFLREVLGSSPCRTYTHGLKITEEKAFLLQNIYEFIDGSTGGSDEHVKWRS